MSPKWKNMETLPPASHPVEVLPKSKSMTGTASWAALIMLITPCMALGHQLPPLSLASAGLTLMTAESHQSKPKIWRSNFRARRVPTCFSTDANPWRRAELTQVSPWNIPNPMLECYGEKVVLLSLLGCTDSA